MINDSPIIKSKIVTLSKDHFVVENGARDINAFLLSEKSSSISVPETDFSLPVTMDIIIEDQDLYERRP